MAAFDHIASNVNRAPAGLSYIVYWAYMDEITTFPSPDPTALTPQGKRIVDDPFVFGTGFCWRKIECIPDTGRLVSEKAGDKNTNMSKNTLTFEIIGSDEYATALAGEMENRLLVFIAPDKCGGKNKILGEHCSPAQLLTYNINTGSGEEARKSSFTIESMGNPCYTYTAAIQLTPTP